MLIPDRCRDVQLFTTRSQKINICIRGILKFVAMLHVQRALCSAIKCVRRRRRSIRTAMFAPKNFVILVDLNISSKHALARDFHTCDLPTWEGICMILSTILDFRNLL